MARKPATKKGTETVTDTNTTAADASATDTTNSTDNGGDGDAGTAWAANAPAINRDLLSAIVTATQGNSFVYTAEADYSPLVAAGYAEVNPGMMDYDGRVATRATKEGIDAINDTTTMNTTGNADTVIDSTTTTGTASPADATTTAPAADAAAASSDEIAIFSVPLPEKKRVAFGGRSSSYPFEKLEVGQSFFVANSEKMPNAKKSLASTVSSATRRFAEAAKNDDGTPKMRKMTVAGVKKSVPVYVEHRKFELYAGKGDAYGKGGVEGAIVARTK